MNIVHLRYAVEVEKTHSINKAAENLFMSQPNLSRSIRELETSLGLTIFNRTSKGITLTPQGQEFLTHAKKILLQIDELEANYSNVGKHQQQFSISVPRASYIAKAFTEFAKDIDTSKETEITYTETNSMTAINNIIKDDYNLGIIRYQEPFGKYFDAMIHENDLISKPIRKFSYSVLLSKNDPLADKSTIKSSDLKDYIEIAHPDPYVPSFPMTEARDAELSEFVNKRIFVFERGSQMELLANVPKTFMWVSPIDQEILDRYGLVTKRCPSNKKVYKDALVYRDGYKFSALDDLFIAKLMEQC